MRLKYSPSRAFHDTQIVVVNDNTLIIDDEEYVFPIDGVQSTGIGPIVEAHRESGELFVTVRRCYNSPSRPSWDDVQYHEVTP